MWRNNMEIKLKDSKGNILFETTENIKGFLDIKIDKHEDITQIKTFTGNKIMNDITSVRVWSFYTEENMDGKR